MLREPDLQVSALNKEILDRCDCSKSTAIQSYFFASSSLRAPRNCLYMKGAAGHFVAHDEPTVLGKADHTEEPYRTESERPPVFRDEQG